MEPPAQALSFKVMRLCKPSILVDTPLRLDLDQDTRPDPGTSDAGAGPSHSAGSPISGLTFPFADRIQAHGIMGNCGVDGVLELPQSFGTMYLGEVRGPMIWLNL